MSRQILLPVDRSDHATTACELAVELFEAGTITFLHVIDPAEASFSAEASVPNLPEDWYDTRRERAKSQLEDLASMVEAHGLETQHRIEAGKPAATIVEKLSFAARLSLSPSPATRPTTPKRNFSRPRRPPRRSFHRPRSPFALPLSLSSVVPSTGVRDSRFVVSYWHRPDTHT
jgi:hypothetical protein